MSIVYWSRTDNRKAFVSKVLEALAFEVNGAQTFFVKVNLVSSEPYPTTTHPETLQAVLEFLSGQDVVAGDAPAIDAGSSEEVLRSLSLRQVCDSHRVPLVNLYKTKARKFVSPRGYRFRVSLDCFGLQVLQMVAPKLRDMSPHSIAHIGYALDYHVGSAEFQTEESTV